MRCPLRIVVWICCALWVVPGFAQRPVKVQPTVTVPIGVDPDTGFVILLDLIEPDPDFPAFQHCPKLNS